MISTDPLMLKYLTKRMGRDVTTFDVNYNVPEGHIYMSDNHVMLDAKSYEQIYKILEKQFMFQEQLTEIIDSGEHA